MKYLASAVLFSLSLHAQVANQMMTLNSTGKWLYNSITNKPVYLVGEDTWLLFTGLSNAQAQLYLADRAARGYNFVWCAVADNISQPNAPQNYYGNVPFDGADFTNFDATYWAHVDYIVQLAASYGITLGISPAFVGVLAADGYLDSYLSSSNATMTAYGTFLGNRYKSANNIVWVLGGDSAYTDSGVYSKLNYLLNGILAADPNHLTTLEACPQFECGVGSTSSQDDWTSANVGTTPGTINVNWQYNQYQSVQQYAAANYARAGAWPQLLGEAWYEGEHSMTELQVRQEGYWGVLSGSTLGYVFGNNPIWCADSPQAIDACNTGIAWQTQLGSPGSLAQEYLGWLMNSREFWLMLPDASNSYLTSGYGSGTSISVLGRTPDGQTMIAYIPNGNATTVTINMAGITDSGSQAKAWWYNPQTGAAMLIGVYANSGSKAFTPPDSNDWVLVIDSNAAGLAAPGAGTPLPPTGLQAVAN